MMNGKHIHKHLQTKAVLLALTLVYLQSMPARVRERRVVGKATVCLIYTHIQYWA